MSRKLSGLSVKRQADMVKGALEGVPVPKELTDPEEIALWRDFSAARLPTDFLRHELVMLQATVQTLALARRMRREKKPDMFAIMKLEKHAWSQLRMLKMTTIAAQTDLKHAKKAARNAQHNVTPVTESDADALSLLGITEIN